ncbi:hypothetical protein PHLCEN_2v5949 [Hermanssonia centrifuga]|uniref:Adenosine deaminase domain-containing protein n=1 Tax=Hermanssonia centrifuga TaxID=98765 RepID=A0A2R6P0X8_9APHY|nr:hypothetical protein PHLCEN_2v5949 [Hermanssonia centrifuga]
MAISGYAAAAFQSLTPAKIQFIRNLPKAELHAHLNGCIPVQVLQDLALERLSISSGSDSTANGLPDEVKSGIERLQQGVDLNEIHEFFGLFPAIYSLTSTPTALATATRAVLSQFLDLDAHPTDPQPQAAYLELRSTPRENASMTRMQYLEAVLSEVERYPADRAALIVSLDRRMNARVAEEVVYCAVKLRKSGRRVVGIDLCGDPLTDDTLPFRNSLIGEYALLMAAPPLGLGMTEAEVERVARMGMDSRFPVSLAEPSQLRNSPSTS